MSCKISRLSLTLDHVAMALALPECLAAALAGVVARPCVIFMTYCCRACQPLTEVGDQHSWDHAARLE
jgi:hypothetical protein